MKTYEGIKKCPKCIGKGKLYKYGMMTIETTCLICDGEGIILIKTKKDES